MDPAQAQQVPMYTTQAVFPDLPNATASTSHRAVLPPEGRSSASRHQHRRKNSRESDTDSSVSNSSESEDDSWTRWEGLRGQSVPSTSSYRHLDTLGGCHEYHISGFSLAHGLGPGVRLCSDYFQVADQLWRVEVYPAGVSVEAAHHLSIFLTTPGSAAASNQVLHKIMIVDQSGKGHHISKSKSRVHGALLASRGIVAAYPKAVRLSHLMNHAKHYLQHDTLLIRANVQVVRSWSYDLPPTGMPEQYQKAYHPSMHASDFDGREGVYMPNMQQR